MIRNFDVTDISLDLAGTRLIEASAGTGKTYTITFLYLHLIIRKGLMPDQIVTVSFTEAAVAQLQRRILKALTDFKTILLGRENAGADMNLDRFWKKLSATISKEKALERVEKAIAEFDRARISTIHAYCLRALRENPFKTGMTGIISIETDYAGMTQECCADLLRRKVYVRPEEYLAELQGDYAGYFTDSTEFIQTTKDYGNDRVILAIDPDKIDPETDEISFLRDLHMLFRQMTKRQALLKNMVGYQGLIEELNEALKSDHNGALVSRLRTSCPAVIIDEFQDTDPVQYEIFSRIYNGTDNPVFFVGDPKQSIFSFRNADIESYYKAAESCLEKYSLNKNFRSSEGLVNAFNAFFRLIGTKEFSDLKVSPGLDKPGEPGAFRLLVYDGDYNRDNIETLRQWCLAKLVDEIKSILAHDAEASEIAVLVRTNNEGNMVRNSLSSAGIPAITMKKDRLYETTEAKDLYSILSGIHEYSDSNKVRSALATETMGYAADEIDNINKNTAIWSECISSFVELKALWTDHGFMPMILKLLNYNDMKKRLAGYSDGERRLTNIFHLVERLQEADNRLAGSPEVLLNWFSLILINGSEDEIRLDSDRKAVKIATIHNSKGLQYPIVFVPFLWYYHTPNKKFGVRYHDDNNIPVFDITPDLDKSRKAREKKEAGVENSHLLYVAVTRAEDLCYLFIGRSAGQHRGSALLEMLNITKESTRDSVIETIEDKFKDVIGRDMVIRAVNENLLTPEKTETEKRIVKPEKSRKALSLSQNSYTSLSRGLAEDYYPIPYNEDDIPRGEETGTLLHSILESTLAGGKWDRTNIREVVKEKFRAFGWKYEDYGDKVLSLVEKTINLSPCGGVAFRDIPQVKMTQEMEFWFPLSGKKSKDIRRLYSDSGRITLEMKNIMNRLHDRELLGWMNGKMDLVAEAGGKYYIVDWKSNTLAENPRGYDLECLTRAVNGHAYFFQYHIYMVALLKYLKEYGNQNTAVNFGGVFYVFLRGIDGPAQGIFEDHPDMDFITELSDVLSKEDK